MNIKTDGMFASTSENIIVIFSEINTLQKLLIDNFSPVTVDFQIIIVLNTTQYNIIQ